MNVTVYIPALVRTLTDGASTVSASGSTVRELIDDLESRYPGVRDRLCEQGQLRAGLTVAVNGTVSRVGLRQRVPENAEVHFLPALGGG